MSDVARPTYQLHPAVFGRRQCDEIVEMGTRAMAGEGATAGGIEGLESAGDLRDSTIAWLSRDPSTEWIHRRLEEVAERANRRWLLDIDGIEEDLQFTVYDRRGDHYTWHHDGLDAGVERRKISLVVQLSDPRDYRGAELEFLEVVEDLEDGAAADFRTACAARGTLVSFPGFEYHRVTPLRSGRRLSLVAWVAGPPLR